MVTIRLFGKWNTPVNPETVDAWHALEKSLTTAGYTVHRAWVYNCRNISGTTSASLHAYGLAIDIDPTKPRCNPNIPTPDRRKVRFSTAQTKAERCRNVQRGNADTSFTPEQVAAVEAIHTVDGHQVFAWGGRWSATKDTMHFQINVTPDELARGIAPDTVATVKGAPEAETPADYEGWDTAGSVLGGAAGGLLGGPLGAVAGSLAGRAWGAAADRRTAPEPVAAPTTPAPPTRAPVSPPSPSPSAPPQSPTTGTVAAPPECVAIPSLTTPAVACPVGTDVPANRPLRMPSPGIDRFEANPIITAFAADLAHCYASRKSGTDAARARMVQEKTDALARDYAATLTAGLVRYGATWRKRTEKAIRQVENQLRRQRHGGQLIADDLAALERERCRQEAELARKMNWLRTGWMVGRREEVDFETLMPPSLPRLAGFAPPPLGRGAKPRLVPIEPEGTGTPITVEAKEFLVELRRRASGFDANNYPGHGGGRFSGRGLSIDLTLRDPTDNRGFYPRDQAAALLLNVDAAARAVGLRWRVLYNDYAVAAHVNRLKHARHVVFMAQPARNLNWHGPLVLHFHLDLAP